MTIRGQESKIYKFEVQTFILSFAALSQNVHQNVFTTKNKHFRSICLVIASNQIDFNFTFEKRKFYQKFNREY